MRENTRSTLYGGLKHSTSLNKEIVKASTSDVSENNFWITFVVNFLL